MKVLWDLGASEIKNHGFNQSFYSSKLLKAVIKIPTEKQTEN